MDYQVSTEDSYAERRQLFKNIWETAMNIEEKDPDIMTKPKVIKTLRLDEVDRYGVSKKKKLKLKNLRTVCNKILDFCDRTEAEDMFYEQMTIQGRKLTTHTNVELTKPKKVKRRRRKVKKSKSLYSPAKITAAEVKPDELSADLPKKTNKASETTKDSKTKKILNRKRSQPSGLAKYKYYYYIDIKPLERIQSPTKKLLPLHKVNIK